MKQTQLSLLVFTLVAFAGCSDPYQPTLRPDYVIRVTPTTQGAIATPPRCPSWASENTDPFDNQPEPQFGCANARNLAQMVEHPDDLTQARDLGDERGVTAVGSIRRYDNNQPRGLVWPGQDTNMVATTTAATQASLLTGDITGGSASAGATNAATGAAATAP